MNRLSNSLNLVLLVPLMAVVACSEDQSPSPLGGAELSKAVKSSVSGSGTVHVVPPLATADAYAAAAEKKLSERKPENWPDLHNVLHLSENIISGSEPDGPEALKRIAAMGVKTILSVDGKAPDAEAAAALGMRYVHVPIRYSGIEKDELLRMTKVFTELEKPIFVHCFHGKHRGPAAAAVARIVLDGATREQALAEMRQWCGTAASYPGLYGAVASLPMPTPEAVAEYKYDFPGNAGFDGYRGMMIAATRQLDAVTDLAKRDFAPDPLHPDLDPANEIAQLVQGFEHADVLEEVAMHGDDFQGWHADTLRLAKVLETHLVALKAGDKTALPQAKTAAKAVKASCVTCHDVYRNK